MTPLLKKGPKIHLHEDRSDIILKLPPPQWGVGGVFWGFG